MKSCVIFGGSGFVGTHLTRRLLASSRFDRVVIADIRMTPLVGTPGVDYLRCDVRRQIPHSIAGARDVDWIFNLAAIHREPGHLPEEYFETNLGGAENITAFAREIGCRNIYFTSSISVYGPTHGPTTELSPIRPISPYGGSKYPAELIHRIWAHESPARRLIISRPGVLYGAGDPGNILRMINSLRKGYFVLPGSPRIIKAFGYIEGLLDSIEATMSADDREITYNYAETPAETLGDIISVTREFFNVRAATPSLPLSLLLPLAHVIQAIAGSKNPIHPVRVRKAATATHIVPAELQRRAFPFRFSFRQSLEHWAAVAPEDFGFTTTPTKSPHRTARVVLKRKPEEIQSSRVEIRAGETMPEQEEVTV